jgi:hypothetical protein
MLETNRFMEEVNSLLVHLRAQKGWFSRELADGALAYIRNSDGCMIILQQHSLDYKFINPFHTYTAEGLADELLRREEDIIHSLCKVRREEKVILFYRHWLTEGEKYAFISLAAAGCS